MTPSKKLPRQSVFLFIGIGFMMIGLNGHIAFIASGAIFFVIGAATLARHRKENAQVSESEE